MKSRMVDALRDDRRIPLGQRLTAAQLVYEDLRERIVSLAIAPNASLSRGALAREYGVSLTPVREAILRLEQEGLVRSYPQSRTVVSRIDVGQVRETHFMRSALEIEIARLLAGTGGSDLISAEAILSAQQSIGTDHARQAEFATLDRRFHEALFVAAGHQRLYALLRQRSGHLDRVCRLHLPSEGKMALILADHAEILAAIRSGDEEAAAAVMRRHLNGSMMAMLSAMVEADPEMFEAA